MNPREIDKPNYMYHRQFQKVEAKRVLYYELLQVPKDKLTDTEVELMFQLSLDKEIRKIFEINKESKESKGEGV